jgi:hypothetical protein
MLVADLKAELIWSPVLFSTVPQVKGGLDLFERLQKALHQRANDSACGEPASVILISNPSPARFEACT